jgi:hypothetical protein
MSRGLQLQRPTNEYSPEFCSEYEELGLIREDQHYPTKRSLHDGYKIPNAILLDMYNFWNPETIDEDIISEEELALIPDGFYIFDNIAAYEEMN